MKGPALLLLLLQLQLAPTYSVSEAGGRLRDSSAMPTTPLLETTFTATIAGANASGWAAALLALEHGNTEAFKEVAEPLASLVNQTYTATSGCTYFDPRHEVCKPTKAFCARSKGTRRESRLAIGSSYNAISRIRLFCVRSRHMSQWAGRGAT